jgi:hypothetical protein
MEFLLSIPIKKVSRNKLTYTRVKAVPWFSECIPQLHVVVPGRTARVGPPGPCQGQVTRLIRAACAGITNRNISLKDFHHGPFVTFVLLSTFRDHLNLRLESFLSLLLEIQHSPEGLGLSLRNAPRTTSR